MINILSGDDIAPIQHVGSMDISLKSDQSHEWNGLSVSNCPEAWKSICGCSGDTWTLLPVSDVSFLDVNSLDEDDLIRIRQWGVDAGYFDFETQYRVSWRDMEDGGIRSFLFGADEEASAREEFEFRIEEEYEDVSFEEIRGGIAPSDKLMSMSLTSIPKGMEDDVAAMLYAEEELGCDGAWFDDVYDPMGLSAPRGVVFNSRMDRFNAVTDYEEDW